MKITTPYGIFHSRNAATKHIARYHGVDFIKQYPDFNFPYTKGLDFYNKGTNNATIHYVYHTIKKLVADQIDGWAPFYAKPATQEYVVSVPVWVTRTIAATSEEEAIEMLEKEFDADDLLEYNPPEPAVAGATRVA